MIQFLTETIKDQTVWIGLTAILTGILAWVAYWQLKSFNKTTRADFINRFTKDFFNESAQEIILLLDYSALKFKESEIEYGKDIPRREWPYFLIEKDIAGQFKPKMTSQREMYTAFELDDDLLGHFDDLGTFEKRGILDISLIYDVFSYYIELVWENEEIQKYIKWQQADNKDFGDVFENFEYIYRKCKSFGSTKRNRQNIWFWKLKWLLCNKQTKNNA
jgi:hypothetical protein